MDAYLAEAFKNAMITNRLKRSLQRSRRLLVTVFRRLATQMPNGLLHKGLRKKGNEAVVQVGQRCATRLLEKYLSLVPPSLIVAVTFHSQHRRNTF